MFTFFLTYSMEQSPSSETNWSSAAQEIPSFLSFHQYTHNCLPTCPILRQIGSVHAAGSHILNIHLNIIIPSMAVSSILLFLSGFPTKPYIHLRSTPYLLHTPAI